MADSGLDLVVEEISRQFGETRALSEVSLGVLPGSVHALVGENGAGKSTLGRIISGVIRPDSGRLLVDGQAVEWETLRRSTSQLRTEVVPSSCWEPSRDF